MSMEDTLDQKLLISEIKLEPQREDEVSATWKDSSSLEPITDIKIEDTILNSTEETVFLKTEREFEIKNDVIITEVHKINSVESLLAVPFSNRAMEEKLEIKRLGRPMPDLNLVQTIKSKNRSFKRNFNRDIYKNYDWLCGCIAKNAFFCFPCMLFGGENVWTKSGTADLNHLLQCSKKHAASAQHIKNVIRLSCLDNVNIAAQLDGEYRRTIALHNEKVKHNRYILNLIVNCIRFCGAFELALRGHNETELSSNPGIFHGLINFSAELDNALKEHLEKATVFKSKTIQNEILQTILLVCQEEIAKEMKEAEFLAIIVDETTDVADSFQMAIVFRYIVKGRPVERFWDLLTPVKHDSKTLSSCILDVLQSLGLDKTPNKLIAQTYDGAAVMSGSSGRVHVTVQKTYPDAAYVHCYAHEPILIMANAVSSNDSIRIFFSNLHGLCTFFSTSSQRIAILDKIVKKRLPRSAVATWNFHSLSVCTVFEHKESIIECLKVILKTTKNSITTNQASGYVKILKSNGFVSWLSFFNKILPFVDILFAKCQSRQIEHGSVQQIVSSFNSNVQNIRNNSYNDSTISDNEAGLKRKKSDAFNREAKEACDIIMRQVKDRFTFTGHLLAATLFFAENFQEYREKFPEENFKATMKAYPFFDRNKLRTELTVIYEMDELTPVSSAGLLALHNFISENHALGETLSEILKLLKILITIPMTSAEAERCFSTLKHIKTFLQNTMAQEKLSALIMLSKERDFIGDIPDFNQRVIEKFAMDKNCRMDFLFK